MVIRTILLCINNDNSQDQPKDQRRNKHDGKDPRQEDREAPLVLALQKRVACLTVCV
jgi:hypothetical protein